VTKQLPKFTWLRRTAFAAEIAGWLLILVFGLTDDSSGIPYTILGFCVLAISLVLWLYCVCAERKDHRRNIPDNGH
jgi:hypothetical protein